MLRSFLLQLLKSKPGFFKQVYTRIYDPPLIYEDLEQLLVDLLSNSSVQEVTLVVHGIDNMDEPSRDQIGCTLVRLASTRRGMPEAKVLLSCRATGVFTEQVEEQFSKWFAKSEMSELSPDAAAFAAESGNEFRKHVRQCISAMSHSHKISSELRGDIEACLLTKTTSDHKAQRTAISQAPSKSLLNNFLWVSLLVELIGSEQSPLEIKNLLKQRDIEKLNDLESVYTRLIERVPSHVGITRILRFIQCARRPLSIEEPAFAITVRSEHASAQAVVEQQFFSSGRDPGSIRQCLDLLPE